MTISTGDRIPAATLLMMGANGPEQVELAAKLKGRKVVLFGLPGAFTGTCSTAHLPSFIRTHAAFLAKGVDEVICLTGNDPFVLKAWSDATGAGAITMLGDPAGDFIQAIGMDLTAPAVGLIHRSQRFAALVEDGVVTMMNLETNPGVCDISAGEALLDSM
jgi:glutaredoxin/glutathione-dependent peroxiredoxin